MEVKIQFESVESRLQRFAHKPKIWTFQWMAGVRILYHPFSSLLI